VDHADHVALLRPAVAAGGTWADIGAGEGAFTLALADLLGAGGRFVVVEYDTDRANPWVPNPFSYPAWERLATAAGLVETRRIGRVPSRFLDGIYSAESRRPGEASAGI
jgi:hypothetical protein